MFADQQPADVGKEEPPGGIVGVGVRLGVLVVNSVVSRPLIYVILHTEHGTGTEEDYMRWP